MFWSKKLGKVKVGEDGDEGIFLILFKWDFEY